MPLVRALALTVGVLVTAFVAAHVLMFGFMLVVLTGGPACWFTPHPDVFVQQVWATADPDGECGARYGMVDDLLANHLRPGMTRGEVAALLGPAEDPDYGYMLGCWIDCDWVTIEYDAGGRLVEAYQYQD